MTFDAVVTNPPYSIQVGPNKNEPIWHHFVELGFSLLKSGGYMAAIHPNGWRNVEGKYKSLQELLRSKQIQYLEMHDVEDGKKTFGAATRYDIYVLKNSPACGTTKVRFQNGFEKELDLRNTEFIPNEYSDILDKIVAKHGDETVHLLRDSSYHAQRDWMNRTKTQKFRYKCTRHINSKNEVSSVWYSSRNDKGHFGVPKVIFARLASGVFVDQNGEYGMTEDCASIVDTKRNLNLIAKALRSDKFISFMRSFDFGGKTDKYNPRIIATFRKDFWKEFLPSITKWDKSVIWSENNTNETE